MPPLLARVWLALRVLVGLMGSGALVMLAVALFDRPPGWIDPAVAGSAAVTCFAAGQFVLMAVVLDAVFPRAQAAVTWTLELTAGLAFWGGGAVCLYLVGAA